MTTKIKKKGTKEWESAEPCGGGPVETGSANKSRGGLGEKNPRDNLLAQRNANSG